MKMGLGPIFWIVGVPMVGGRFIFDRQRKGRKLFFQSFVNGLFYGFHKRTIPFFLAFVFISLYKKSMPKGRKNFFSDYYEKPLSAEPAEEISRLCDAVGCVKKGTHRAPRNRRNLKEYSWFCKEHAGEYNTNWDYLKGLTAEQIEEEIRADILWRRSTGHRLTKFRLGEIEERQDPFGFFKMQGEQKKASPKKELPERLLQAVKILNISFPITRPDLKKVYKIKVKQYHPDLNKGSKEAEEKFKEVITAFQIVEEFLGYVP